MKGLLRKDFCLVSGRSKSLLVLLLVGIIMAVSTDGSFVVGYLTMLGCIMANGTISYDEFDNGYPFLLCLPITRKDYVKSKYIFGFLMGLIGLMIGYFMMTMMVFVKKESLDISLLEVLISNSSLMLLILSIMLPLQIKFGSEKSRTVMAIFVAICYAIAYLAKSIFNPLDLSMLNKISATSFYLITFLASIGLILISYLLSVKIVLNKEY